MRKYFYLAAVASIAFATLAVSGQKSVEAFRKGFDAITERLPKLLEEQCKNLMENPPPPGVRIRDLVSKAEIMRLLSEKDAKISVTFKGILDPFPKDYFEGKFDMYLSYFDGSWTVSKWEATWNRENPYERGNPDADWARPINYFAHKVVLLVDKISEK